MLQLCLSGLRRAGFLTILLGVLTATLAVANPTFTPVFNPILDTKPAASEIKLDGRLDDAAWSTAARTANFVERAPGDNTEPPVRTEVLVTYGSDNLYVGFICHDDPSTIRATMSQRDQYGSDDEVMVALDTYGDAAWAYEFKVNPYGIQRDMLWTKTTGENQGFDLIWESAAHINDSGYTVEIAIPFASLRFPNQDVQSWRMDFMRGQPRETYRQYTWSPNTHDDQCWPCQWGTVKGIEGVRPGKGLELLPSFVSTQAGQIRPDMKFRNDDVMGNLSLGTKYSVNSDVTVEGTYNPDFSQIEADAAQVDVNSTISLFYPERRPFFQEGSDLFITLFNSFYTRMVNDPNLAAKATARWNGFSMAYTMAHDEKSPYSIPTEEQGWTPVIGKSTVNVVRGLGNIGNGSTLGLLAAHRAYEHDGSGIILAGDGELKLNRSYSIVGQGIISNTKEPMISDSAFYADRGIPKQRTFDNGRYTVGLDGETYTGTAFITELRRRSRYWNFTIDYNQLSPTYRTQIGYDPWTDQRNFFAFTTYNFRPSTGIFERIFPQIGVDRRWNFGVGDQKVVRKWAHFNANLGAILRWAQTYVQINTSQGSERWFGDEYKNVFNANLFVNSQPFDQIGYNFSYSLGQSPAVYNGVKGHETSFSAGLELKPIDRLIIEPSINYARSKHVDTHALLYEETIARTRVRLQVNPQLSIRLVVQYDDYVQNTGAGPDYNHYAGRSWEFDPLLTYRINSFSMFYLGSTHDLIDFGVPSGYSLSAPPDPNGMGWRQSSRQFFMKLQYLFQI